jgi:hypothetical protein
MSSRAKAKNALAALRDAKRVGASLSKQYKVRAVAARGGGEDTARMVTNGTSRSGVE